MSERPSPGYGTPNWEMIGRWLELPAEEDGPFWALNLMKYRAVADYGESTDPGVSGKAADDAYSPLGPLAAIGAMVAFHGDVLSQSVGEPRWDRIGIVRYPTRAAFFAMQQRDDFKKQHVHKEAGMDFTIVMACHPSSYDADADAGGRGRLVLIVERGPLVDDTPPAGVTPVASFSVEGVIVGDERSWDRARFVRVADDEALARLLAAADDADEAYVMEVDTGIDDLGDSILSAPTAVTG